MLTLLVVAVLFNLGAIVALVAMRRYFNRLEKDFITLGDEATGMRDKCRDLKAHIRAKLYRM